ncbi:hypothetical protein BC936DRAFT_144897 [Jimgerdemannia flammicorona]|uniref:Uncharacterized protein n=1 Tax=Jimgerdemannia flammicorona TaxID=994334 RepID=A0A433DBE9_9FUNG|nr:hypothetical protein BC936DRAFT_144897 [Jimgerdemannia flammicorona]
MAIITDVSITCPDGYGFIAAFATFRIWLQNSDQLWTSGVKDSSQPWRPWRKAVEMDPRLVCEIEIRK